MTKCLRLISAVTVFGLIAGCGGGPPVTVHHRDSILDMGKVIIVTNNSDKYLHGVKVRVSAGDQEKTCLILTIAPHDSVEVGWMQLDEWKIPEGSETRITCDGFRGSSGPWLEKP